MFVWNLLGGNSCLLGESELLQVGFFFPCGTLEGAFFEAFGARGRGRISELRGVARVSLSTLVDLFQ